MEVNISRTAREADSASVAPWGAAPRTGSCERARGLSDTGSPTNFRQGGHDHPFRHVLDDLDFPHFPWENEVNRSAFGFLVGPQKLQGFCILDIHLRQRTPRMNRRADAIVREEVAHTHIDRDTRGGLHSPGNRLSVKKMFVPSGGLKSMTERVAQV